MEASAHDLVDAAPTNAEPHDRPPTRLECLGGVIVSPLKTFEYLASNPQWLMPLIVIVMWALVNSVIEMVVTIFSLFAGSVGKIEGVTAESLGLLSIAASTAMFTGVYVALLLIILVAMAGLLYAIARAFQIRPRLYPLIATLVYAEFVPRLIGKSCGYLMQLLTGEFQPYMLSLPTSIAPIFRGFGLPTPLYIGLQRIDLFHLWSLALVAVAIRFVFDVTGQRALLIAILYWIVCILAIIGWWALWLYVL